MSQGRSTRCLACARAVAASTENLRRSTRRNGWFPWLTLRHRADLNRFQPMIMDPRQPDRSRAVITTPSGAVLDVADSAVTRELGSEVRVIKLDHGIVDSSPLSLITTETVRSLAEITGRPALDAGAFPTEPSHRDRIRSALSRRRLGRLRSRHREGADRIDRLDGRCSIVNLDPATGDRDPSILRAVAVHRDLQAGVYASTVEPGRVVVGDNVYLGPASSP